MKKWIIIGVIIVILIVIRLLLPSFVLKFVNKSLSDLENYEGSVKDVDMNLYRGAYVIDSIEILNKTEGSPEPFIFIERLDISLHWSALFRGVIAGEIVIKKPELNFVVTEQGTKQDGSGEDWTQSLKNLMPVRINRFEIEDGKVNYKDYSSNPKVDVFVDSLFLVATNISNANKSDELLPASIYATGTTLGNGLVTIDTKANLIKQIPDFDLDFKLENMNLISLNNLFKAYTKTDIERGNLSVFIELALNNGTFTGYLKPVFEDLKFVDWGKKEESNKLWESIVGFFAEIFENQPKDQLASRIPLNGNIGKTEVGVFPAIWTLLRNAFIESLGKNLDFSVDVEGSSEEKKDDKSEKNKKK